MLIVGAGLAGLLAANMLRRWKPTIIEAQPSLPNNHESLLRFRSDAVSKATGIPFKEVRVQKVIKYQDRFYTDTDLRFNNMYSRKVTGDVINRSIINLEPSTRYIAPPDFIAQMARSCDIEFNTNWILDLDVETDKSEPIITTIPLPALAKMANYKIPCEFNSRQICTLVGDVEHPDMDVYQTIYYPGSEPFYRASITGSHIMIEMIASAMDWLPNSSLPDLIISVLRDFGIFGTITLTRCEMKTQEYGKISPIPSNVRKSFILAMTDRYNIYSVGRFATWRQILLDDVVNDIRIVEQFIDQRNSYEQKLHAVSVTKK